MLWALPSLPLAIGLLLLASGRRGDRPATMIAIAALLATAGLAVWAAAARPEAALPWLAGLPLTLAVDGLSAVMVLAVTTVALAVLVYGAQELAPDDARARCFGFLLVFVAAMLLTVTATSLAGLLIGWELMGLASYALIGFWWSDPKRPPAANRAYLFTRAGDIGLYVAAGAALASAGTLAIAELPAAVPQPWLDVIAAGLILTAAAKSAQLPFSIWLSAAMQGPTHISALLHSATLVAAGGYLLLRTLPILAETTWALPLIAWLGAITAVVMGLVALAQRDLKQMLAASTAAQKGLIFLAVGASSVTAGTGYILAHATFKPLLFIAAGVLLYHARTTDLQALGGRGRATLGGAAVLFALGALALAGLPPFSAWVIKDEILAAALAISPLLYATGLAASFVTALYAGKMLILVWRGPPLTARPPAQMRPADPKPAPRRRLNWPILTPMTFFAVGAIGLAALGLPAVRAWWQQLLGQPVVAAPAAWELALSGLLSVAGLLLAASWWRSGRLEPWAPRTLNRGSVALLQRWLELDHVAVGFAGAALSLSNALNRLDTSLSKLPQLAAAGVLLPARLLARADDQVVDAGVRAAATLGRRLAQLSERGDRLAVDAAVTAVASAFGHLGRQARRPQSGLLHQYYAQSVSVLAALALLLWLIG